ncbi:hypothetical protein [Amycolatopsis sp.]|uniref:hypothetical protein n=1 Tax=Amycolatopsis sp. TaxID=37632 RepID=UPI002C819509|nr:hypothetical protein [Amycolatopsis sp.]HVV11381.1 hypothetical protein [Amycolatopsis sp.]
MLFSVDAHAEGVQENDPGRRPDETEQQASPDAQPTGAAREGTAPEGTAPQGEQASAAPEPGATPQPGPAQQPPPAFGPAGGPGYYPPPPPDPARAGRVRRGVAVAAIVFAAFVVGGAGGWAIGHATAGGGQHQVHDQRPGFNGDGHGYHRGQRPNG